VWSASSDRGRVAVKFYHGGLDSPSQQRRIELELDGLGKLWRLTHPHLLAMHDLPMWRCSAGQRRIALVTELADGTLDSHFRRLRVKRGVQALCGEAIDLLAGPAAALDHLREQYAVMHLDIKPGNLLLVSGRCKVSDFGTVTRLRPDQLPRSGVVVVGPSEDSAEATTTVCYRSSVEVAWGEAIRRKATLFTGLGAFTAAYAPPEAFSYRFSKSFDQYSLALTFCELVTGVSPFAHHPAGEFVARVWGAPDLEPLPRGLRPVLAKALSPTPKDRYHSCTEFIVALSEALGPRARGSTATVALAGPACLPQAAQGGSGPVPAPRISRPKRRDRQKKADKKSVPGASGSASAFRFLPIALVALLLLALARIFCGWQERQFEVMGDVGDPPIIEPNRVARLQLLVPAGTNLALLGVAGVACYLLCRKLAAHDRGSPTPAAASILAPLGLAFTLLSIPAILVGWLVDGARYLGWSFREGAKSDAWRRNVLAWTVNFAVSYSIPLAVSRWVPSLGFVPGQALRGEQEGRSMEAGVTPRQGEVAPEGR
jgi:serine/threonine protein kinase